MGASHNQDLTAVLAVASYIASPPSYFAIHKLLTHNIHTITLEQANATQVR